MNSILTKLFLLFIFLFYNLSTSFSQPLSDSTKRSMNALHFGILGDGLVSSLNYERVLLKKKNSLLIAKIGIGLNDIYSPKISRNNAHGSRYSHLSFPHSITMNLGKKNHYFELGMGASYLVNAYNKTYFAYPIIGYRIHPMASRKILIRAFTHFPKVNALISNSSYTTHRADPQNNIDRYSLLHVLPFGISIGIGL